MPAKILNVIFAQIDAIQKNAASGWIIKTRDEFDDGCLALAVLTDERDAFAGFDTQIEVVQNDAIGSRIFKGNILKFKPLLDVARSRQRIRLGRYRWLHFKEGERSVKNNA